MLLIVAASLKAYGVLVGPQSALPWNRLSAFALIEFELLVGGLLLLNSIPTFTWGAALAMFTIFAGVSARKAMLGSSSCGCFGPASVSPRVTVAIDLAVVVLLLCAGPRPRNITISVRPRSERISRFIGISTIALLMLLSAAAVGYSAIPKRGLVADQPEHDFGLIPPHSSVPFNHTFLLRNTSTRPVQITNCHSSCGCTVADYPTDAIAPGSTAEIKIAANWVDVVTGEPEAQITLTTDNWWTRTISLRIHATIADR